MAAPGGIFDRIGNLVVRWPLLVIACWIVFAGALAVLFPPLPVAAAKHPAKPLPDDAPTSITSAEMAKAFSGGGSSAAKPADNSAGQPADVGKPPDNAAGVPAAPAAPAKPAENKSGGDPSSGSL
jgi:putative drug exporter of the RND superfamily